MADHPLAPPNDPVLLEQFIRHYRLDPGADPLAKLTAVTSTFSQIPYENLTKIIKSDENGQGPHARRPPGEVLADHQRWGTGGTCFSLTAALAHLLPEPPVATAVRPGGPGAPGLLGTAPPMQELFARLELAGASETAVHVFGTSCLFSWKIGTFSCLL